MQKNKKKYINIIFLSFFFSVFFNYLNSQAEELKYKTAEQYYLDGIYSYVDRSYATSADQFEALSKNHPYSQYTRNSLVMEAFTNYLNKEYEKIKNITSVFFKLFPNDQYEPYMLYILAMSNYINIRDVNKNYSNIVESRQIFTDLINKHPGSKYVKNAEEKIVYLNKMEQLGDVLIGELYQKNDIFISAIRRYANILNKYKDIDPEIEERTLCGMISSLHSLNMTTNMKKYIEFLTKKYPKSKCLNNKNIFLSK